LGARVLVPAGLAVKDGQEGWSAAP